MCLLANAALGFPEADALKLASPPSPALAGSTFLSRPLSATASALSKAGGSPLAGSTGGDPSNSSLKAERYSRMHCSNKKQLALTGLLPLNFFFLSLCGLKRGQHKDQGGKQWAGREDWRITLQNNGQICLYFKTR